MAYDVASFTPTKEGIASSFTRQLKCKTKNKEEIHMMHKNRKYDTDTFFFWDEKLH